MQDRIKKTNKAKTMTAIEFFMKKIMDKLEFVPMEQTILKDLYYEVLEMEKQQNEDHISDISKMVELSDEEILMKAIEHSELYTNKFVPRNAFFEGAKWYREQLKKKI